RESQVLGADLHGHQEIAQHGGDGRDEEEEDHHHAVHGEELVIGVGLHQVAGGSEQLETDQQGEKATDEKEERDREQVEERNALVVGGEHPRGDAVLLVQVIDALNGLSCCCSHTHST